MNINVCLSGCACGYLKGRELTEEGGHVAGHALQKHQPEAGAPQEVGHDGHHLVCKTYFHFRTEEAAKYLEATKLQTSNGYTEEFTVMEDLMGLAIGLEVINKGSKQ